MLFLTFLIILVFICLINCFDLLAELKTQVERNKLNINNIELKISDNNYIKKNLIIIRKIQNDFN